MNSLHDPRSDANRTALEDQQAFDVADRFASMLADFHSNAATNGLDEWLDERDEQAMADAAHDAEAVEQAEAYWREWDAEQARVNRDLADLGRQVHVAAEAVDAVPVELSDVAPLSPADEAMCAATLALFAAVVGA